jgi:hypothetical protein
MKNPVENIHIYLRYLLVIISVVLIIASQRNRNIKSEKSDTVSKAVFGTHESSSLR